MEEYVVAQLDVGLNARRTRLGVTPENTEFTVIWLFYDKHETVSIKIKLVNGRDSFQLFVGVLDTCLVLYLLVLPSQTHAVANMTSLKAIDCDTSYHSYEYFSLPINITQCQTTRPLYPRLTEC